MQVGGVIATVVVVGLAAWVAVRRPYDKEIRRGERVVRFAPGSLGGAGRPSRGGVLARIRLGRRTS